MVWGVHLVDGLPVLVCGWIGAVTGLELFELAAILQVDLVFLGISLGLLRVILVLVHITTAAP